MTKQFAVYTGYSDYVRDFGDGNRIELKRGIAVPVSDEVAKIMKDMKDIVLIQGVSDKVIDFKERLIREPWDELVKRHGIKKAKLIREGQDERIRQATGKETDAGSGTT